VRVYDLVNAGPRHRYVVEGRLVHNCFRMSALGFREYARNTYGVVMSEEEAESARDRFFETYPGILAWHGDQVDFARRNGYVRSPLGRVRHLPLIRSPVGKVRSKAERQSINSPVQGTLSDMTLWTIVLVQERLGDAGGDLLVTGMTHDSVYGYVASKRAEELLVEVRAIMENLPLGVLGWEPQVTFPVDVSVGPTMAELSSVLA